MLNNSDEEAIHEHDFIFQFLAKLSAYQGEGKALAAYLAAGRDSAVRLRGLILEDLGRDDVSLLEFAAGYGCVSRHLRDVLPQADITACDIHDEAVRFIEDRFRVKAVSSTSDPDKLSLGRKFDIVFALSFFSHMPKESWTRWLRALARHTAPDGEIIFTTHGLRSVQFFPDCQLDADGFWFKPVSEQGDLSTSEYGSTVTTFDYVYRQISNIEGLNLVRFHEGLWWGHQDLYVARRANDRAKD
jgi:SAM-dependent methyltransferase